MANPSPDTAELARTPLHDLHVASGARMVPFAGYSMPVQFEGIIAEHKWTRTKAGLFDVSHMGQRLIVGPDFETTAHALEALTPGAFQTLRHGAMRYTLLLNEDGGIIDDLMVTRSVRPEDEGKLFLVVNAARKGIDDRHLEASLPGDVGYHKSDDLALLALQGPAAEPVLARHCPEAVPLGFMTATYATFDGIACHVTRSGYTGEDGFEIAVAANRAEELARLILADDDVRPAGLGARDSLRLEAGLPLYGNDLDETTSPIEAGLAFAVARSRREGGGFPGAERILAELRDGPLRRRVGIRPQGRAPVREGAAILAADDEEIGRVTSGGFGPSVGAPVAMGYVDPAFASPGTEVRVSGRRGPEPASVAALPFVPHNYKRI